MSPGWFPCCADCEIFTDDFNRSNSTNLGGDWTETAGDWSIASNQLSIASTAAFCLTASLTFNPPYVYFAESTLPENSKATYIIHYEDASNYLYVEHERITGLTHNLRMFSITGGGSPVQLGFKGIFGEDGAIKACVLDGIVQVEYHVGGGVYLPAFVKVRANADGAKIGFGTTLVPSAITFDDLRIEKHELEDSNCPDCEIPCENCDSDHEVPSVIQAVISGMADPTPGADDLDNCPSFNGTFLCFQVEDCLWRSAQLPFAVDSVCSATSDISIRIQPVDVGGEPVGCDQQNPADNYQIVVRCDYGDSTTCTDSGCQASFLLSQVSKFICDGFSSLNIPKYTVSGPTCDNTSATCELTSL